MSSRPIIHIVDDEAPVRRAISRLLRASGYRVAVYESVEQLLDRLPRERGPGCILLDVLMPDGNGLAARERLMNVGVTLPVVFMTGAAEPIPGDAENILFKPVLKDDLLHAIERALQAGAGRG
jgi:FixJ family two-component response regulator